MHKYTPAEIEKKWQEFWDKNKTFAVSEDEAKKKFFALIEFPYPSGAGLHVGHSRPFTAMDVIARKRRMQGENVLYPIGFDAFGLPTENFAIKTGRLPSDVTAENIATFTRQLKASGFSFDWSRVVDTTDPAYFKWTQWLFLQFYKHGLAYKKNQPINWCPKDKIGLANEEVVNGCCERCGTAVERRDKEQWMLAITKYADKLLAGLKDVDYIPQAKTQQENWIGKSEGARIIFSVIASKAKQSPKSTSDSAAKISSDNKAIDSPRTSARNDETTIEVFTTRPDTLFGVEFLVVAPEHKDVEAWVADITNADEVRKYIEATRKKSDLERTDLAKGKSGVELKGLKALHPLTGKELPIFVADYVLPGYGTGAIMAVPAHDERDFEFAQTFGLPVREVVEPLFKKTTGDDAVRSSEPFKKRHNAVAIVKHWSEDKYLCFKWKKTDWRGFVIGGIEDGEDAAQTAAREIVEETGYTSAKLVRKLGGIIHAQYYQVVKSENRWAHFQPFLFQLENGDRKEVSKEEQDIQDLHWVNKNEVDQFLSWVQDMRLMWKRVLKDELWTGEGVLTNSHEFTGLGTAEAREKIIARLEERGLGKKEVQFKLRDWVFSRQRYWGEPIPLVFCFSCANNKDSITFRTEGEKLNPGWIPLPESELPLKLPKVEKYEPTDTGESPLAAIESWVKTTCPRCGGAARRETDTMPNWAGSSWYFLRYCDPHNDKQFASSEKLKYWMTNGGLASPKPGEGGVDWYNGGMEHTVLHLLYSRFWNQFLFDIGLVPVSEPYKKRTSHGLILAKGGEKMSKSKGNVVNPDDVIADYGADTLRTYIMFMGPFDQPVEWDTNGLVGVRRFLEKVWGLTQKIKIAETESQTSDSPGVLNTLHRTIKKVSEDIEAMRFNTAVASLMELSNDLAREENLTRETLSIVVRLVAPFAPHLSEELWRALGEEGSVAYAAWPAYDSDLAKAQELEIAVQVNGKVRDTLTVAAETSEDEIKKRALASEKVIKWLEGNEPKKIIYVKGKLLSVVV